MAITAGQANVGIMISVAEVVPASATNAAAINYTHTLGTDSTGTLVGTLPAAALTSGTGTGKSINVVATVPISLAGSAAVTVDLSSISNLSVTKVFTKIHEVALYNSAAANAANSTLTLTAGASNGWTTGPYAYASIGGTVVKPDSLTYHEDHSIAGMAVSASIKALTITAGSVIGTGVLFLAGE